MIIRLVVGDWSDDGHGKHEAFHYRVNTQGVAPSDHAMPTFSPNSKTISDAYNEGCKILGFDLHGNYCTRRGYYVDYPPPDVIPVLETRRLVEWGLIDLDNMDGDFCDPDAKPNPCRYHSSSYCSSGLLAHPELWAELYMKIAKLGNPCLTYEKCEADNVIHIDGYGLYH